MNENVRTVVMVVAWTWVGVPFLFGLYALINRAIPLFTV